MDSKEAVKLIKGYNTVVLSEEQFEKLWGDHPQPEVHVHDGKFLWDKIKLRLNELSTSTNTSDIPVHFIDALLGRNVRID